MFNLRNTYKISFRHTNFNGMQLDGCPENLGAVTYCTLIRLHPKRRVLATGYSWTPNLNRNKNRKRAMANTLQQVFPDYPGKRIRRMFWNAYFDVRGRW